MRSSVGFFKAVFFSSIFEGFSTFCRKIQKLWFFDAFSDRAEYSSANCSLRICCNLCDFVQKVCPFGIFWELHSLCLASLADKPLLIFMEGKSVVAYPLQTEASHALSIFPESWKSIVDGSHEEWGSCSRIATGVLVIIFGSHMKNGVCDFIDMRWYWCNTSNHLDLERECCHVMISATCWCNFSSKETQTKQTLLSEHIMDVIVM